jgi:hypothetical protein
MPKIKNIIIYVAAALALILIYIFFIRKSAPQAGLVASQADGTASAPLSSGTDSQVTEEFLALLLSVKNIKLNDTIFSDPAFATLRDSSIILTPDGTEGRINPFAPIGSEGGGQPPVNISPTTPPPAPPATSTTALPKPPVIKTTNP